MESEGGGAGRGYEAGADGAHGWQHGVRDQ